MENNLIQNKTKLCKFYSKGLCKKNNNCTFIHDTDLKTIYNIDLNKQNKKVNKKSNNKNKRNTECFEPIDKHEIDMQFIFHNANINKTFNENLTSKDVILIDNLFNDFNNLEIYNKLVSEIESCENEKPNLLKLWHGNDKINGTHYIADDKLKWKYHCPTFNLIIERLTKYFNMNVQATRFNWYKDTSQWKPYHFDASSIKPEKASIQNFTLAASFGVTRDVSFERDTKDKTKIRFPLKDGQCYAFCKDTNILWRHGILQEKELTDKGRISIILWGWVDY
jgi:hypothetical protein